MKLVAIFVLTLGAALAEYTHYDGYKVYQITPRDRKELQFIQMFAQAEDFDFWSAPRAIGKDVTIMVAPAAQKAFNSVLDLNKINYNITIADVESTIEEERRRQSAAPKVENGKISLTQYHRYGVIVDYLNQMAQSHPDIVSLEDIGVSVEGRSMPMIKIGTGGSNKPIIFIEAGIHAREWISPAFALYMIDQLVENPANRHMIETVDWYIITVLNPDGYEWSHTNARLWRKTRRRGLLCHGVDGNRNFDYHWMTVGASDFACSETFAGPSASSEPEIVNFENVVRKYGDRMKLHLSVHSFGQYILYPWGWTTDLPHDIDELHALGVAAGNAIEAVSGTVYTIGTSSGVLYATSGSSGDWIKGVGGVELTFTYELPGGGIFGFDLPASRIQAVCEETWQSILVFHEHIAEKFGSTF